MTLWKGEEAGFKERQLVVLRLLANGKSSLSTTSVTALTKRFDADPQSFTVVLIGKDGHDAYRSKEPVTAQSLFSRIDAMPMRREEVRRQKARE